MAAARSTAPSTAAGVEERHVTLDHPVLESVSVRVRRNRRARHVRLHVDEQGEVSATVPVRFAARRLDQIVRERAEWLHDVLVRMELKARDTEVDLERGDPVRWLGRWIPTRLERGGRRPLVQLEEDDEGALSLYLRVPEDDEPHDALVGWYRKAAREVFECKAAAWAERFGLRHGKVSIRNQRTRWGSCTYEGDLSFNWRLVLAPEWVLDSIVVHELCHIDELNHSDRFWALVDERFPRHEEASEWLREHGPALRVTAPGRTRLATAPDERVGVPAPTALTGTVRPRTRSRRGPADDDQIPLFGD
jgi:predicted metal-dependent hydrolase